MRQHEKINYLEFPAKDIEATKAFFNSVFDWEFVDYGPEYTAFSNAGIDGGFFKSPMNASTENGSVLIVFFQRRTRTNPGKSHGGRWHDHQTGFFFSGRSTVSFWRSQWQ